MSEGEIRQELAALGVAYPAFRFSTRHFWDRTRLRWVAERIDGLNPGLHTVITPDLRELHAALDSEPGHDELRALRREAALRAML